MRNIKKNYNTFSFFPRHPLFPIIPAYNPAAAAAAAAASFQSLLSAGLNPRPPISGGAPEYHSLLTSLAISTTTTTTSASGATSHTVSPSTGSPPSPSPTLGHNVGDEGDTKNRHETIGAEEMDVDNAAKAEGALSAKTSKLPPSMH